MVETDGKPKLTEGDLKRTVTDFLEIGQAQGRWLYLRLNAGSFIITDKDGNFRRRIKGAPKGTADFIIIEYYTCLSDT